MTDTCTIDIQDYEVSPTLGFLPEKPPLDLLPDSYYAAWEQTILLVTPQRTDGRGRACIDKLPILSTARLRELPEWRRAFTILSILAQIYIWDGDEPSNELPAAIASPLLAVSEHLGIEPCATFATYCLWNIRPSYGHKLDDAYEPENLREMVNLSGTKDEEWFFSISASIEAKGGPLIPGMIETIREAGYGNTGHVGEFLNTLADRVCQMHQTLNRMYEACSPTVFYHDVRPLLNGGRDFNKDGQQGVLYKDAYGGGRWFQHTGGSNAQSSLIQLIDIFLGVDHSVTAGKKPHAGFHSEMRSYMPGPHRQFLALISQISNIREFVFRHPVQTEIRIAYQRAISEFTSLRQSHIIMAARYIVMQGKKQTMCRDSHKGTGGTEFMPFLKDARDGTLAACPVQQ